MSHEKPAEKYIYIFVRQDISFPQQLVQSNHATHMMAALYGHDEGIHNIVVIGVPNEKSLNKVLKKLETGGIPHFAWREPDFDLGFTAICTSPLDGRKREILKNYRVYSVYSPGTEQSACLLTEDGRASIPSYNSNTTASRAGNVGENPTGWPMPE